LHRAANLDPHAEVTKCEECGEITSRQICQSCTMKRWLIESHSR
jgi:recombinational DNA repair protein RecR